MSWPRSQFCCVALSFRNIQLSIGSREQSGSVTRAKLVLNYVASHHVVTGHLPARPKRVSEFSLPSSRWNLTQGKHSVQYGCRRSWRRALSASWHLFHWCVQGHSTSRQLTLNVLGETETIVILYNPHTFIFTIRSAVSTRYLQWDGQTTHCSTVLPLI